MTQLITRALSPEDAEVAAAVYFDAVQNGTADVYSRAERNAWAGPAPDPIAWHSKLRRTEGVAAEIDGALVGFMTLDAKGYIDLAFVWSDLARCGIGRRLYELVEARAVAMAIQWLTVEASLKAKPFFMRLGCQVDREQTVLKEGVGLINYKMSKRLEIAD